MQEFGDDWICCSASPFWNIIQHLVVLKVLGNIWHDWYTRCKIYCISCGREYTFSCLLRLIRNLSRKLDNFSFSSLNKISERNGHSECNRREGGALGGNGLLLFHLRMRMRGAHRHIYTSLPLVLYRLSTHLYSKEYLQVRNLQKEINKFNNISLYRL